MILSVASLTKQKDLGALIEAFALVRKTHVDQNLAIVGDGPESHYLSWLAAHLNLGVAISFFHPMAQEELAKEYRRCDLFVLPSINEGFGMVLAEAQMHGRPVIGTDSGGIPEIIQHLRTGLLFSPGDYESLATLMKWLLGNPYLASFLGNAGCQAARARFSEEKFMGQYMEVLR